MKIENLTELLLLKSKTHFILIKSIDRKFCLNESSCIDKIPQYYKDDYEPTDKAFFVNGWIYDKESGKGVYYISTHFFYDNSHKKVLERFGFKKEVI